MKQAFAGLLCFIRTLASIVNTPGNAKCISLNTQQCMTQPTFINLYPNEYIEGLRYYAFAANLNRGLGICNTLHDLSNKVCVPNKTEDLNMIVFNMIREINESKMLTKHISFECKCQLHGIKYTSNQKWNNEKCWRECKNLKEDYKLKI